MDWYNNASSTWLNNDLFSTGLPDGVDLRSEIRTILYGSAVKNPLGHWVIVRNFDRTNTSEYWNKYSKEGVGGPAHPYTDVLLRTRRIPAPRNDTEFNAKVGNIFSDQFVYYFEYNTTVQLADQIYELDVADHTNTPTSYNFTEKYDIRRVHPYRENNGNVQYYAVISEYSNITY